MKKKMLQFVDLKQETPVKRSTTNRKEDFNEIYNEYITDKAKEQSSRCSQSFEIDLFWKGRMGSRASN